MITSPILMEDYFSPGFKTKPAVHVGSQTMRFYHGDHLEQAVEGFHLAAASGEDVTVLRNADENYLSYWHSLIGRTHIVNLSTQNKGEYLTNIILDTPGIVDQIKQSITSKSKLMVYFPTLLEKRLANTLGIPLHGSPKISKLYGTKSGIRSLAKEVGIPMASGFICKNYKEVVNAVDSLRESFATIVFKHDQSSSGRWIKKADIDQISDLKNVINEVSGGKFVQGKDTLVVEGWLKAKASLCAHIEIPEKGDPVVCAAWQQIIDLDGISYIGAKPLMLSQKAFQSFLLQVNLLAKALHGKGAYGSFGPDFLITSDEEKSIEPDTSILIELNARVPITAFPLEIVKQVKGNVGNGFCSLQIKAKKKTSFSEITRFLQAEKLLITKKDRYAKGAVIYNAGQLPWNTFNIAVMADTWHDTERIMVKVRKMFT